MFEDQLKNYGIERGGIALDQGQFERRAVDIAHSVWPTAARELRAADYETWKSGDGALMLAEAQAINAFNHQLNAYRAAVSRLAQYRLADGRGGLTALIETGEFDEDGQPITSKTVIVSAIDALPATVMQDVTDPETGEVTGQEEVPNPSIVADDAERAAAQAVVDATPDEVKAWTA